MLGVFFIMVGYPAKISCSEDAVRCRGGGEETNRTEGQIWVSHESDLLTVSGVHVGTSVRRASGGATDHDSLNDG